MFNSLQSSVFDKKNLNNLTWYLFPNYAAKQIFIPKVITIGLHVILSYSA